MVQKGYFADEFSACFIKTKSCSSVFTRSPLINRSVLHINLTGFPPTWKVRESQGKLGNLGGQGKSGKSQGILDGVREKEEKKKKREINKRTRNKKEREYII